MFWKDTHDSDGPLDFRPAVHDSGGLAAWNGHDEHLWRPLVSPSELQISYFRDSDPKGFGLVQRERQFDAYQDLEAHYQDRPSAWVEPARNWGDGSVQLVEIPTETEYFDNIVAYWRPDKTPLAGQTYAVGYRLSWCDDAPAAKGYRVGKTRIGKGPRSGTVRFVVDFLDLRNSKLEQVASVGIDRCALAAVAGSCGRRQLRLSQRSSRPAQSRVRRHPGDVRVRSAER